VRGGRFAVAMGADAEIVSVNTDSVSFGTTAAILLFQMGFIDRSIDRIVTALSGTGSDKVIPTYKQPNAPKSLAPQRKSTVSGCREPFWRGLRHFPGRSIYWSGSIRALNNSMPARPNMARLRVFKRLLAFGLAAAPWFGDGVPDGVDVAGQYSRELL
jgi:hypothetical protein